MSCITNSSAWGEPTKPNVVVFLIDDLGCCDLGVSGSRFYETPHLDALAKSGVRFDQFYSAHPVCSPTRAALMTGKVPQRLGITDWIHPQSGVQLAAEEVTLGEAFQKYGYQTGYVGKWHLGEADKDLPTQHGFDWIRCVNRAGHPGSYYYPYRQGKGAKAIYDVPDLESVPQDQYLTDGLTNHALEFVEKRDPNKPFLLYFGHYAVHTPIQPPKPLLPKYQAKAKAEYGDSETPLISAPNESSSRGRQDQPDYAAMMENLDTNIGKFLNRLEALHLRENTIIVFTSDNGGLCTLKNRMGPTCNLPFRSGKGWTYEGGIRIATIISWPGQLSPAVNSTIAYSADLYPTLLELCQLPFDPKQHMDGKSLAKSMRGHSDASLQERFLAWYYPHDHGSGHRPSAALRQQQWKLIYFMESEKSELYNLESDLGETKNLSSEQPERTAQMKRDLLRWIDETKLSSGK